MTEQTNENQIKILLLDDNPGDLRLIERRLEQLRLGQLEIRKALDLESALQQDRADAPDIVLVDYWLSKDKGTEIIGALKSVFPYAGFVILTGQGNAEIVTESLRAGADDYLSKDELTEYNLTRMLHYVQDKKAAEKQIMEQSVALKRANAELERFAYVASHDLQAPLRRVRSFADLLQRRYKDQLDATGQEYIAHIDNSVRHMKQLIDVLLEYSRLGRQESSQETVDMQAQAAQVVDFLEDRLAAKNAVVIVGKLPEVTGNRIQLLQVLQNLVGNALKFNDKSRPEVRVSARDRQDHWLFLVQDNGIGIAPENSDRIFDIFQRLHCRQQFDGTGIGLSICKKVVELHGGCIAVRSRPGKGTTFFFTLPKQPQP